MNPRSTRWARRALPFAALSAVVLASGCEPPAAEVVPAVTPEPGPAVVPEVALEPVDLVERPDVDLDDGTWGYRRRMEVDLDGDGVDEEVLLAAQAERVGAGEVAWDDGQAWAIRVGPTGGGQLVYARFVQLGRLQLTVLDETPRALLVEERTPHALRVFRVEYPHERGARVTKVAEWPLDPSIGWDPPAG
jgi:hypothetical protein